MGRGGTRRTYTSKAIDCTVCGAVFWSARAHAKTCSAGCRKRRSRWVKKLEESPKKKKAAASSRKRRPKA